MIAESVAFLVGAGQARRLRRRALLRRLARRPGLRAGLPARGGRRRRRERRPLRHERRRPARPDRGRGRPPSREALRRSLPSRHPHPRRRRLRGRQLARRGRGRRDAGAGDDQRLSASARGNANLVSIIADLQLKMGFEVLEPERLARLTETAHFVDELLQPRARPRRSRTSAATPSPTRAGMHVAGVAADARDLRAHRPGARSATRARCSSPSSPGAATIAEQAERAGHRGRRRRPRRAIVERVKEREHRGYHYEAADASFELLLRRETGAYEPLFQLESLARRSPRSAPTARSRREATIKIWVDGERYVRTAEGNGPVNALDSALRDAITEMPSAPGRHRAVNYKVRILDETHGTGAITRVLLDASDGDDVWGTIGVSENVIEASWEALVDSLEYPEQPGRAGAAPAAPATSSDAGVSATTRSSRSPGRCSARRRSCRPRGAALRAALAGPERAGVRAGVRRPARRRARERGLQRHRRPAPGAAGRRRGGRRRGRHVAVLASSPARTACSSRARGRSSRRRPGDAEPRPAGRRGGGHGAHDGAAAGPHLRLPGRPAGVRGARACPIVEDACEALGAVHADGTPVGGRGNPAVFAFYANKQLTTGEGGMVTTGDAAREGADATASATRAARPTWAGSTTTASASTTASPTSPSALGLAQLGPPRRHARARARGSPARYREALAGRRGARRSRARTRGGDRRSWFVFVVQVPADGPTATTSSSRCASAASRASPTCPRSTS